jgi:hypothetical protein
MRLAERRDALVAESARRRAQLALQFAPVRRALGIAGRVAGTLAALARLAPLYALLRR